MRISDWSSDVCSSDLSATETVGRQLGLIQSDVTAIRSDVSDLHEMAQPHMIIKRPASAADHFNNAWLYHTMQRNPAKRSEEHTSELQSLMRSSYAVFCLKTKKYRNK